MLRPSTTSPRVALLGVVATLSLVAGCGLFHTPLKVNVSTALGPKAQQWTLRVSATGDGQADAGLFITYPDGHTVDQFDCLIDKGTQSSATLDSLPRGTYAWTVYAAHIGAGVKNVFSLPSKDLMAKNVVASGKFMITASRITVVAGRPGPPGSVDGPATTARFFQPQAIACDARGDIYVVDADNVIRKISRSGVVTTVAGRAGESGAADGPGSSALFNAPSGIACDTQGNLYVADTSNNTIRKVLPNGRVITYAGDAHHLRRHGRAFTRQRSSPR